jgi:predicted TIM-barrel fold metal-dependent hydrolase
LFDLLKEERVRNAKINLVHGGYPNVVFASYLANAFPNVFMDISIATPFGLANLENRIKEAIELAPASKVMYASDGYYIPELHWAGAILFKKALKRVLNDLINTYKFDEDDALRVARMIAYENAERVYGML